MADDKEKLYELKQNDELLGKRGRMISDRIYNILPQESKDKFKEITSNRRSRFFIPTTNDIIASINIPTATMDDTIADVWVNSISEDDEFDEDDEEETDFDSEDESDIDF